MSGCCETDGFPFEATPVLLGPRVGEARHLKEAGLIVPSRFQWWVKERAWSRDMVPHNRGSEGRKLNLHPPNVEIGKLTQIELPGISWSQRAALWLSR